MSGRTNQRVRVLATVCIATCGGCGEPIEGDIHHNARGDCMHPGCIGGERASSVWTQADLQRVNLILASPKRADPGRIIPQQHDASDCPLFVAANEPRLL